MGVLVKLIDLNRCRLQQLALDLDNTLAEALNLNALKTAMTAARSVRRPCCQQGSCSLPGPGWITRHLIHTKFSSHPS